MNAKLEKYDDSAVKLLNSGLERNEKKNKISNLLG